MTKKMIDDLFEAIHARYGKCGKFRLEEGTMSSADMPSPWSLQSPAEEGYFFRLFGKHSQSDHEDLIYQDWIPNFINASGKNWNGQDIPSRETQIDRHRCDVMIYIFQVAAGWVSGMAKISEAA